MRCLVRNKQPVWYCLYRDEIEITDGDGNLTGEKRVRYFPPVEIHVNVSPATGNTITEQFGTSIQYDNVIVTEDVNCPIDENTVLFVGKNPQYTKDGLEPLYNYIVKKVAKSLNSISIAIARVAVT